MKNICVFCGSESGANVKYGDAARDLGRLLAKENIGLVYGGGGVGLMGELADAVMANGGKVTGVIPGGLVRREAASKNITDLCVVKTMHQRKDLMNRLSDAFIAMPGGLGTLEEFAEIITWAQLGIHRKPCGLLNAGHYYDNLIAFLDHAVGEKFVRPEYRALIMIEDEPQRLIARLKSFVPPEHIHRWVD